MNSDPSSELAPELTSWGWSQFWADEWSGLGADRSPDQVPARVIRTDRGEATVRTATGELRCTMTTRAADVVAGDWVVAGTDAARVEEVLPRRTQFIRRAARGALRPQALAANMDIVAVCHGLDRDVNPARIERELVAAAESGAEPIVVLTKADLADDAAIAELLDELVADGLSTTVVTVSASSGPQGLGSLDALVPPGTTIALIGSSGVGKSSIANLWSGLDGQSVGTVRRGDRKGRHTTTAAELIRLPGDRLMLDTPGIRALALWSTTQGLDASFTEIAELSASCQFANCSHTHEPGCAVIEGVANGKIVARRLDHYRRLSVELDDLDDQLTRREWR